nr:MAG TPA: YvrJ protein family protein [Caudoviricetes sp.]
MEALVELIPTLGFPIVCCVAVGLCFYQMLNKVLADSKERENNLMQLTREISSKIAELGQIVDKNTEAISVMNEKIENLKNEMGDRE